MYAAIFKPARTDQPMVQSFSIHQQPSGSESASVNVLDEVVDLEEATSMATPHFVKLKGFLVPAPLQRKDLTYATVDISVKLTTSSATRLIKEHTAFYRNIIYDVLKRALTSRDKSKINEISLKIAILKAINDALPERSVKDVIVDAFIIY
jgi:flagellar basal body-associated protein FliL